MSAKNKYILGISAFFHDSSACLLKNGKIIAAAQEERFTRIKFDASFPINSINFCLKYENITIDQVDTISYFEDAHLKFDRIFKTYLYLLPFSFKALLMSMYVWVKHKLLVEYKIKYLLNFKKNFVFYEHHYSHASSAFFPSPFLNSAILILDAVGEWDCTSIGFGKNNKIEIIKTIEYPNSLGMIYSAFTEFSGFKVNSGEYKLMGLAPYGKPKYKDIILNNLISINKDGSHKLNLKYFNFHKGFSTINTKFEKLFNSTKRKANQPIRKIDEDMASSIQEVFNDILIKLAIHTKEITKSNNLVLAGGVALNCVSVGKISNEKIFENVWVQPAAGDAGTSIGAALAENYKHKSREENDIVKFNPFLGPSFTDSEIKDILNNKKINYQYYKNNDDLVDELCKNLMNDMIIGLFQGRMEFGPRALGSRSIIADPRSENMQKKLNQKIKYRESFRPFAPAILKDYYKEHFNLENESPFMSIVAKIKHSIDFKDTNSQSIYKKLKSVKSNFPAITHVDNTARVQTVDEETNKFFYNILLRFNELTGCPMLINTSFNVNEEPIVCTPGDAIKCFYSNDMDILVINNFLIRKNNKI